MTPAAPAGPLAPTNEATQPDDAEAAVVPAGCRRTDGG